MLTVEGLPQLANHIRKVNHDAKTLDLRVVGQVALVAKKTLIESANPKTLSRFADGRGIKLSAKYTVKPGEPATATLLPTPPGPWYLLEYGGKEHQIGKRTRGRGRRGTRNAVGFLGAPGRFAAVGPVQHPAFKSKHTWAHAAERAELVGSASFRGKHRAAYLKLFAG